MWPSKLKAPPPVTVICCCVLPNIHSLTCVRPGGLIRWPVRGIITLGFFLLTLQGISEIIKRYAAIIGMIQIDPKYERPLQ